MNANLAGPQSAGALRFAALLATYMQSANLPLPNAVLRLIQGSLSMTDDQAGWIFTSYLAASAITMPIAQWLAGRYGLKRVYQTALAFFVLGLLLATHGNDLAGIHRRAHYPRPGEWRAGAAVDGDCDGDIATGEACEIWRDLDRHRAVRHRQRPEHRWLGRRAFRLASDLLHQPAAVGVYLPGDGAVAGREESREASDVRFLRLRHLHAGIDQPANVARPR